MTNEVKLFNNEMFGEIQVVTFKDQPMFVAKEIATILGYSATNAMNKIIDEDDKAILEALLTKEIIPLLRPFEGKSVDNKNLSYELYHIIERFNIKGIKSDSILKYFTFFIFSLFI